MTINDKFGEQNEATYTKNIKKGIETKPYGYELIIDLQGCDVSKFTRRKLKLFFKELCELIQMQRCKLYFWDAIGIPIEKQQLSPHAEGISAVQFILTSSIVIHTLDLSKSVYINIFSCKSFNEKIALDFSKKWFSSTKYTLHHIKRGILK